MIVLSFQEITFKDLNLLLNHIAIKLGNEMEETWNKIGKIPNATQLHENACDAYEAWEKILDACTETLFPSQVS